MQILTMMLVVIRIGTRTRSGGVAAGKVSDDADYLQGKITALRNPADILVEALPKAAKAKQDDHWRDPGPTINGALVADLLAGLESTDPELGSKAVDWLLNEPKLIDRDRVLLPAALALRELDEYRESVSVIRLSGAVAEYLRRRIAESLLPPADWSRPAKLSCRCSQCNDLSRFLANATQSEWRYKTAQARRSHLEETIRNSHCDVDGYTETKGRPHTLCVEKTRIATIVGSNNASMTNGILLGWNRSG